MKKNNEILASLPEGASQDERRAAFFDAAYSLNVNDKCEKKENLTYLSWAYAWAEFKKIYPSATYRIVKNPTTNLPYFEDENTGLIVYTEVTADGITYEMWLPVMNSSNKAMKSQPYQYQVYNKQTRQYETRTVDAVSMFDVNKSLMRCLVKNLSMFGLGLYIYAGEDLPENESVGETTNTTQASEPKKQTSRKAKSVAAPAAVPQPAPVPDRFSVIKNAIASTPNTDALLDLYLQHKNEVEGNAEIKALFTARKQELRKAA
jgi:hypothetical protein